MFRENTPSPSDEKTTDPEPVPEPLFLNSFEPLQDSPTDKPSTLSDTEMQAYHEQWAEANPEKRSTIADDPFDEIFERYRYVLEMDNMATMVKKYWHMAARGEMPIPLAAWLTSAGFYGVELLCEAYQDVAGVSSEVLATTYIQKKAQMQIKTGQDLSVKEA